MADYLRHVDAYGCAGVDLTQFEVVGLGSVVGLSASELVPIVGELAHLRLRLHGFGVKTDALEAVAPRIASADSMAWSFIGRRLTQKTGQRDSGGRNLANSQEFAEQFRSEMLSVIAGASVSDAWSHQLAMPW